MSADGGFYKIFPFWQRGDGCILSADRGFYKIFLFCKEGTVNFFLYLKEKRLQKRSKPACRWIARAINFVAPSFSFPEIAVPQNSASATRRAKRLEIVGSRTGGSNLMARCVSKLITRTTQPTHWLYDSWEVRAYGSRWVPPQIYDIPTPLFSPQ